VNRRVRLTEALGRIETTNEENETSIRLVHDGAVDANAFEHAVVRYVDVKERDMYYAALA